MIGTRHLCSARRELLEGDGDERDRLRIAAREFARALVDYPNWPARSQAVADRLRAKLLAGGGPDAAVRRMDEETLREVSDELWRFCEIAEPCPWDRTAADVKGIEHLREARTALYGENGDLRDRLKAAAHRFWSASFHVETWPSGLRTKAEALTARLFRHGKIDDAVGRMGNKTAGEISQDILRLCDEAEREDAPDGR